MNAVPMPSIRKETVNPAESLTIQLPDLGKLHIHLRNLAIYKIAAI